MTWPAPSAPQPAPPALPPSPPGDRDRRAAARPIATWLAATGGALVLVAAVIVVAGNWRDIAPGVKFAGLLTATAAVVVAAELGRRSVPATARTLAHLGVTLLAPVAIAATAVAHGTWPTCIVVGGVAAAIGGELQRRRWAAPLMEIVVVGALGLAVTGLAARLSVPVGILGAAMALALVLGRRNGAAAAFAIASIGPTAIVLVTEWRVGAGTLARIGATGESLAWSAPIAGFVAGGVLAIVATRLRLVPLAVAALLAPVVGVATGLAQLEAGPVFDAATIALAVLAVQALAVGATRDPWRTVVPPVADALAVITAIGALLAPWSVRGDAAGVVVPILIAGAALLVATMRLHGHELQPVAAGGTVGAAVATAAATGAAPLSVAAMATVLAAIVVAVDGRRRHTFPAAVGVAWGVLFLAAARGQDAGWSASLAIAVVVALMGVVVEIGPPGDARRGRFVVAVLGGAVGVAICAPAAGPALFVAVGAAGVLHVAVRRPVVTGSVLTAVVIGSGYATIGALALSTELSFGLALGALAAAALVGWWRTGAEWMTHVAAVVATAAVPFGLAAAGASAVEVAAAMLVAAVVLTGWSYVTIRITALATAGVTAGALGTAIAWTAPAPVLVSLGLVVVGLQAVLHGATRQSEQLVIGGVVLSATGVVSLWSTTGANDAVLRALGPYGVTGADLAVAAMSLGALVTGWLAGRRSPLSSWVSAAPGIGLAAGWLLVAELERDVRWSLPALLTIGLVAAVVGGVRRLAAPLVIGTATLAMTVLVTTGARLAQLDSWAWLTIGGVLLIAVAVLVERAVGDDDRDGLDWHRLHETWR